MAMIKVVQESADDVCPLCGVSLGEPRRATRRQVILSPRPGTFCWRCPDCKGVWAARSVPQPAEDAVPAPARPLRPTAPAPAVS